MTRKLLILLFPLLLLVFVSAASAQTVNTVSTQTATDAASKLKEQMRTVKDQRQKTISEVKDRVKAKREEVREIVAVKREEFKVQLQAIKDQKKKALVERIAAKLSATNVKHTDRFAQALSSLQALLDRISSSATDPDVLANIKTAQAAIDAANTAVENQAAKTYSIAISEETALKSDVGATVSQLRQDLVSVHKLVVDAKQAVQKLNVNRELIKKEATNSAKL